MFLAEPKDNYKAQDSVSDGVWLIENAAPAPGKEAKKTFS